MFSIIVYKIISEDIISEVIKINIEKREITVLTAQRIRQLRKDKKMSQEELAFQAGLNPAYLGHIERGLKCPTIETLDKIVCALGIEMTDFFDFNNSSCQSPAINRVQSLMLKLPQNDAEELAKIIESIFNMISNSDKSE